MPQYSQETDAHSHAESVSRIICHITGTNLSSISRMKKASMAAWTVAAVSREEMMMKILRADHSTHDAPALLAGQ